MSVVTNASLCRHRHKSPRRQTLASVGQHTCTCITAHYSPTSGQRYFFPFTSRLITVENLSIPAEKNLRNNSCIIHRNTYYKAAINKPNKLAEKFQGGLNTFFSTLSPGFLLKVINFAVYQQDVDEGGRQRGRRLTIKRYTRTSVVDNCWIKSAPGLITYCTRKIVFTCSHY